MSVSLLRYRTTEEDYVALSRFLLTRDKSAGRRLFWLRWGGTAAIAAVGITLSVRGGVISLFGLLLTLLFAVAFCLLLPLLTRQSLAGGVSSLTGGEHSPCGEKTLRVQSEGLLLQDSGGETELPWRTISLVYNNEKSHLFVLTHDGVALTIPFSAFSDADDRQDFYSLLLSRSATD